MAIAAFMDQRDDGDAPILWCGDCRRDFRATNPTAHIVAERRRAPRGSMVPVVRYRCQGCADDQAVLG